MLTIISKFKNYFRLRNLIWNKTICSNIDRFFPLFHSIHLVNHEPSITNNFYIQPATTWPNPYFPSLLMSMPCETELKDFLMSSSITLTVDWGNQVHYSIIVGNTFGLTMICNSSHAIYNPALCDPQRVCKFSLGW